MLKDGNYYYTFEKLNKIISFKLPKEVYTKEELNHYLDAALRAVNAVLVKKGIKYGN